MNGLLSDHDCAPAHRVHFDPTASGRLSSAVTAAIATVTDRPPRSIAPLYETIDPEAIEQLLEHAAVTTTDVTSFGLEFTVDGLDVIVTGDGTISVYDCGDDRDAEGGESEPAAESGLEFTFEG